MKIFLICPVGKATIAEITSIELYIERLEIVGYQVHWPLRDTNQEDPIGLRILRDNVEAMKSADEVHIWWSETSRGSLFDLGVAFALGKPVVVANSESIKPTPHKSFENVLLELAKKQP